MGTRHSSLMCAWAAHVPRRRLWWGQVAHYEVLDFIDDGAYGQVYRARNSGSGELVAVKVVQVPTQPDRLERLQRELDIGYNLQVSRPRPCQSTMAIRSLFYLVFDC